jgi:hypothetical protein
MTRAHIAALVALAGCISQPNEPTCNVYSLGDTINTSAIEQDPWMSADYDELFFESSRSGKVQIYRATRPNPAVAFSPAVEETVLEASTSSTHAPFLAEGGLRIWFTRDSTLYTATRASTAVDFDPQTVMPAPGTSLTNVNAESLDSSEMVLYVATDNAPSFGHLYTWILASPPATFWSQTELPSAISTGFENHPSISSGDGRLFFDRYDGATGRFSVFHSDDGPAFSSNLVIRDPILDATVDKSDISPMQLEDGISIVFASNRYHADTNDYDIYMAESCY